MPQGIDRTGKDSWKTAFLLWDHPRYVFGLPRDEDDKNTAVKRLDAFKRRIHLSFPDAPSMQVYKQFSSFTRTQRTLSPQDAIRYGLKLGTNSNLSFKLRQATDLVCQIRDVVETVIVNSKKRARLG